MEQDKSTILFNSKEATRKQIPRQNQSRWKNQTRDKSVITDRSTMTVDLTKEANKNFSPKPEESLLTHATANYCIEGVMGHDKLS